MQRGNKLFIKPLEGLKPVKESGKIFLEAEPSELDRLHRRCLEVFPQKEIVSKPSEHFALWSQAGLEGLSLIARNFSEQAKGLSIDVKSQSYILSAEDERISIYAGGASGLYYGMLALLELFQKNAGARDFFSHPVYPRRGFLQDLSRGQVLNRAGWERLVEALSFFRFNWLTFNLEHNFGYEKHPEIPDEDDQLTKAEAKALFELCKEHYIEVVPMQQSFGHCRGILSREKYRHLAFDEKLLWSLDPRKDEVYSLLEELYEEQCECFPGDFFLVGCDEPFDLKKFWKPETGDGRSFPEIYLAHLLRLHQTLLGLKRRMMVWGDIFVEHPELLARIPDDVIIINWQYGTSNQENEDFYLAKSRKIADSAREFYVATTTWSYARLFPEIRTMEANNKHFLKAGENLCAKGALLTNWGDLGHLQLLGYIAPALGYFGAQSFKPDELSLDDFGRDFSQCFFGDESGNSARFYLVLDKINEVVSPGKFLGSSALFVLLDDLFSGQYIPACSLKEISDQLLGIIKDVEALTSGIKNPANPEWLLDLKPVIYALGILFSKFLVQENASLMFQDASKREEALILFGHLSAYFQEFAIALKDRWMSQAKPRGLENNLRRLVKVIEGYQKRLEQLKQSQGQSWEQFRDSPEFSEYKFNLIKELGLEGLL